jgi:hypothetical protein
MLTREEQGKLRAGKITGSVAHTIMHGCMKSWETLKAKLWADDGSGFVQYHGKAAEYGHAHEQEGIDKFWERHPEFDELPGQAWIEYKGMDRRLMGMVGVSIDSPIMEDKHTVAGLEIKSPTSERTFCTHITPPGFGPEANPHYCQIQHGLFTTNWGSWYLVVHLADHYFEQRFDADLEWQFRYTNRLHKFLDFYDDGKPLKVRKLKVSDL